MHLLQSRADQILATIQQENKATQQDEKAKEDGMGMDEQVVHTQ